MNTGSSMPAKFDYKLMLLWHLNEISKISSRYFEREFAGNIVDPDKEYKRAVITLSALLQPYWDKEYKDKMPKEDKLKSLDFLGWAGVLGNIMELLHRKQWLMIEDETAEDEEDIDEDEIES